MRNYHEIPSHSVVFLYSWHSSNFHLHNHTKSADFVLSDFLLQFIWCSRVCLLHLISYFYVNLWNLFFDRCNIKVIMQIAFRTHSLFRAPYYPIVALIESVISVVCVLETNINRYMVTRYNDFDYNMNLCYLSS